MIPKRTGDRVKTNRRDAVTLVKLLRAGELHPIWVPDTIHEAVRDLARAREAAMHDLKEKRQQLLSFLLRHGRSYPDGKNWTKMHARWLTAQKFTPCFRPCFKGKAGTRPNRTGTCCIYVLRLSAVAELRVLDQPTITGLFGRPCA
jgi:transposase